MFKRSIKSGIILFSYFFFVFSLLIVGIPESEHEPLSYNVQVNAQVVPIFAVDDNGNPVFDLKEDEIVLYINKKPYPLLGFSAYKVSHSAHPKQEKITDRVSKNETDIEVPKETATSRQSQKLNSPERINFIILDGVANSKSGIRNAKKLAKKLILSGSPNDGFIILKATAGSGLQYVIGPEKRKAKLLAELDRIYLDPSWILLVPARAVGRVSLFEHVTATSKPNKNVLNEMPFQLRRMSRRESKNIALEYRSAVGRFSRSLEDLKYALKSIRLPKTVFLVSGAVQDISGDAKYLRQDIGHIQHYYESMKKAAVEINKGGSLLYMINPIPDIYKIKRAISIMSKVSNAKCIFGPNVDSVLKKLKNNTSAYYEAAFSVTPKLGDKFRIKVKCKRKGVTLNTLEYGEKFVPYVNMENIQKELFALNVVIGGSWSRIIGKISKATYKKTEEFRKKKNTIKKVIVNLPQDFKGKYLDVFILNLEPETLQADFETKQLKVEKKDSLTLEVEAQKKKNQYIVLIEPENTFCLFTPIS